MDHISTLLPKSIAKHGLQSKLTASQVIACAQEWIEKELPNMKDDLTVTTWKDATLIIEARNSIASQECHMHIEELKEHIREKLPKLSVLDIRIVRSNGKTSED